MSSNNLKWLNNLLESMKNDGEIDHISVEKITNYASEKFHQKSTNNTLVMYSIIGTVLISLGLMLLVAHNWLEFSANQKAAVGSAPFVISIFLGTFTLLKKYDNNNFRETSALAIFFATGTALAAIGQAYHIDSTIQAFILGWLSITFLTPYIFGSSLTASLYLLLWCGWVSSSGWRYVENTYLFYFILFAVLPYIYLAIKKRANSAGTKLLVLCMFFSIFFVVSTSGERSGLFHIQESIVLIAFYLAGRKYIESFGGITSIFAEVFNVIFIFILSFEYGWEKTLYSSVDLFGKNSYLLIGIFLFIPLAYLLADAVRNKKTIEIVTGSSFIAVTAIQLLVGGGSLDRGVAALLMNMFIFIYALVYIVHGAKYSLKVEVNKGLVVIAFLIGIRFFDSNLSFISKALVFISIGIAFIVYNIKASRKNRGQK